MIKYCEAIASSVTLPIYFVRAEDKDHGACWYYLEIDQAKHAMFKKKVREKTNISLADYGRIITSGWGETPSESTLRLLRSEGIIE